MKPTAFACWLLAAFTIGTVNAATVETRDHTRLEGSLAFTSNSCAVTDAVGKTTTVLMKDVARIAFFDSPKTVTPTNVDWTSTDVGEVYATGSTSWTNGTMTLTASGWGLWRDADGLRFASVPLPGDGEIIARVRDFDDTNGTVLAGLSIRESTGPRARHVSLLQSSKGALAFRSRDDDGFTHRTLPTERSNSWLRLTRSGPRLTASISADGKNWGPVEGASINGSNTLLAGVFVSTEVNASLGTATFAEVIIREGTVAHEQTGLPAPAIVLRDGTVLAGRFTATNDAVQLVRGAVTNEFNINGLAALLFRPVADSVVLQPTISPTTGVVMNDRDWLAGEVREFTPRGVVLGTVIFGEKTVLWSERPAAIVLGGRSGVANWEIILKDGSQLHAHEFSIDGARGKARTAAVAEVPFTISELLEIRASNTER